MISNKIIDFFEFKVQLISIFLHLILLVVLGFFNFSFKAISSLYGQFGCVFVVLGFLIRTSSLMTGKYLNSIKITGFYVICRQPLTLANFFILLGLNFIIWNIFFIIISIIIFVFCDIYQANRYDNLLEREFKEIWNIYQKKTNFLIPIPYRFKDFLNFKINENEFKKSISWPLFIIIYLMLIIISFTNYINM